MFTRKCFTNLMLGSLCLLASVGCGHHRANVVAVASAKISQGEPQMMAVLAQTSTTAPTTAPSLTTYKSNPAAVQFDYPHDWIADKATTACFAICAPKSTGPGYSSLSLDIPKMPWHLPGMITAGMVVNGYVSDLKKHQIHDAVVKEQCSVNVCGCQGQRVTCQGHEDGKPSIDIAVILVHADQIYILSADSDDVGSDSAKKTLDTAVASMKWNK